jgi:hypothetical protein
MTTFTWFILLFLLPFTVAVGTFAITIATKKGSKWFDRLIDRYLDYLD